MLKYLESHALAGLAMVAPFETLDAGSYLPSFFVACLPRFSLQTLLYLRRCSLLHPI